jgi:hypothetical protein
MMRKPISKIVQTFMLMWLLIPSLAMADVDTKLLLHFDGNLNNSADGSTTTHTVSAFGNAGTVSTPDSPHTIDSDVASFDGNGDYLSIPDSDDFELGASDFTIELWAYPTSNAGSARLLTKNTSSTYSPFVMHRAGGDWAFYSSHAGVYLDWSVAGGKSLGSVELNTWQHLAVTRQGNTFYAFKNGVEQSTWTSSLSIWNNTETLVLGRQFDGSQQYAGYLDEVRISKGVARWTSDFSNNLPTSPYGAPTDTTSPVISLLGNSTETVLTGATYTDAGASASDNVDGDITANITITGLPVDTNTTGTTTITYNVSDASGNAATPVTRTVSVVSSGGGGGTGSETRIVISSLPFTIDSPGSYVFSGNLVFTGTTGDAITINSSDVTVDFNGYSLIGPGIAVCTCHGIAMGNYKNVVIRNGTVKLFGGHGICNSLSTSSGYRISKMRVHSNGLSGVYLEGNNHTVTQSTVYENGSAGSGGFGVKLPGTGNNVTRSKVYENIGGGINTGSASKVNRNTVNSNTGTGIQGVSGNNYSRNTVYGNTGSGMSAGSGNNFSHNNVYSNTGSGITGGSGCNYVNNNVYSNTVNGIIAGLGARVRANICYSNGHSGITAANGSMVVSNTVYLNNPLDNTNYAGIIVTGGVLVKSNTLSLNGIQNIHVSGNGNVIENNMVNSSGIGVNFVSGTNFYTGNKAYGNTTGAYVGSAVSGTGEGCVNTNVEVMP